MRQPSEGFPLCACKPCVRLYPHRPSLYDKPVHLSLDLDKPCGLWVPYLLKDSLWPALKGCSRCCHQSGGSVIQRRIVALRFESQSWKKSLKVLVSYFNQFSMAVTFESTSPNLSLKMTQSAWFFIFTIPKPFSYEASLSLRLASETSQEPATSGWPDRCQKRNFDRHDKSRLLSLVPVLTTRLLGFQRFCSRRRNSCCLTKTEALEATVCLSWN